MHSPREIRLIRAHQKFLPPIFKHSQSATSFQMMSVNGSRIGCRETSTGDTLIRAGAPEGWKVGDKSGAGSYGTRNDITVVWPPNREPIVIAIMRSEERRV